MDFLKKILVKISDWAEYKKCIRKIMKHKKGGGKHCYLITDSPYQLSEENQEKLLNTGFYLYLYDDREYFSKGNFSYWAEVFWDSDTSRKLLT